MMMKRLGSALLLMLATLKAQDASPELLFEDSPEDSQVVAERPEIVFADGHVLRSGKSYTRLENVDSKHQVDSCSDDFLGLRVLYTWPDVAYGGTTMRIQASGFAKEYMQEPIAYTAAWGAYSMTKKIELCNYSGIDCPIHSGDNWYIDLYLSVPAGYSGTVYIEAEVFEQGSTQNEVSCLSSSIFLQDCDATSFSLDETLEKKCTEAYNMVFDTENNVEPATSKKMTAIITVLIAAAVAALGLAIWCLMRSDRGVDAEKNGLLKVQEDKSALTDQSKYLATLDIKGDSTTKVGSLRAAAV